MSLWTLDALGRLDHAAYAAFGAFASVYGGARRSPGRWRVQATAGALLTAAVVCGTVVGLSPHRAWWAVPVAAAWAALGAALSDRYRWRPPGPMFLVFAVATCAAIPTRPSGVGSALLVAAAAATLAVALGALEVRMLPPAPSPAPAPAAGPWHPPHRQRVQAVRCAAAVLVAGAVTTGSGLGHPAWAMIAAVVPLSANTLRLQVARGVHRVVGTVLGLGVAALLLLAPLQTAVLVMVVAGLQAATELLVVRHYGAALVFITPLALVVAQLASPQPTGALLASRLVETAIGVVVGVAVAVATRPRRPHGPGH